MNRRIIYSALIIAVIGTVALWFMKRPLLIMGWWLGAVIGLVNFSTLLASLNKVKTSPEKSSTGKFQKSFFLRYVLLAAAFFLVIQLGKDQLGSAVLGFLSLYIALFLDYFLSYKKRKAAGSQG